MTEAVMENKREWEKSFEAAAASLDREGRAAARVFHEKALALGYAPKISAMSGGRENDWKCEYTASKPRRVLCILRITGEKWSLRAKLYHLGEYENLLENLTADAKNELLARASECGSHGGGCKGPVRFNLEGKTYSKCRHSLRFDNLEAAGIPGVEKLLEAESALNGN